MAFFNFIFNTLHGRINDPGNKRFWLPDALRNISGPNADGTLLPLYVDSWSIGTITGETGDTIASSISAGYLSNLEGSTDIRQINVIPDPDSEMPTLSFKETTILGLHNQWLLAHPPVISNSNGYDITVTLKADYYDGQKGKTLLEPLGLSGKFTLVQKLAITDKKTKAIIKRDDVVGNGTVKFKIEEADIKARLHIDVSGDGPDRTLSVVIKKVEFISNSPLVIDDDDLYIESSDEDKQLLTKLLAIEALTSDDAAQGIFAQINASLNQQSNLEKLSEAFMPKLMGFLDGMFGTVSDDGLPYIPNPHIINPVDSYLFDRIKAGLNSTGSNFYLPKIICGLSNPSVEPLMYDTVDLPDQTLAGLDYTQIKIRNIHIKGLSNLLALPAGLLFNADGELDATLTAGLLNPPPSQQFSGKVIPGPPLNCIGLISVLPEDYEEPLQVDLTINVTASKLHLVCRFSGEDANSLSIKLNAANLVADTKTGIEIKTDDSLLKLLVKKDGLKKQMLEKFNEQITANLETISRQITTAIISAINSQLDS